MARAKTKTQTRAVNSSPFSPLYLKSIQLKHIRCFEHLSIDLSSQDRAQKWALILGENGVGKTTVLRSIAMGLTDETSASGLLRELGGEFIRNGQNKGLIEVVLGSENKDEKFVISTRITRRHSGESEVKQTTIPRDFPWHRIFACGYGATRRAMGSPTYEKYRLIDSVYTLFNYTSELQSVEVPFFRLQIDGVKIKALIQRIETILMLPKDSIRLSRSGFTINGIPLGATGDGFASTFTWISDLIGWAMLFQMKSFNVDLSGVVLIDELEQHIHPRWQRRIIGLLSKQFPNLQFIATTHAPMMVVGTTDLSDDEIELIVLKRNDPTEVIKVRDPPRHKRADQVLTSILFGLPTSSDDETRAAIHRYAELTSRSPASSETPELVDLRRFLDKTIGSAETEFEQKISTEVKRALRLKDRNKGGSQKRLIDFEIIRQLRELFK